jgi:hypothetical protein
MTATTYKLEEGTKVLAKKRAFSHAFPKAQIVPAWRVVGSDGTETKWSSIREEACVWGRMLQGGYRPVAAY